MFVSLFFSNSLIEPFKQTSRKLDIKSAYQSMSIKEGNTFEVKTGPYKRRRIEDKENDGWGMNDDRKENAEEEPKLFQEYFILEREGPIDEITIFYGDIASLQMLGIINLANYRHLTMIPPPLLAEASYVIRVFQTIISTKGKIHISDCSGEFEDATTCRLEDLFTNVEEELPEFFKIKKDIFIFSEDEGTVVMNKNYNPNATQKKKAVKAIKRAPKPQKSKEVICLD